MEGEAIESARAGRSRSAAPLELSAFLPVLRRWWWLILLATVLAGVVSWVAETQAKPTYEARTDLLVGPINTDIDTLRASGQLAATYAGLATNAPLLESTVRQLRLPLAQERLRAKTSASANTLTRVLSIRVRDGDPALAIRIANTIAAKLIAISTRGAAPPAAGQLRVVDPAQPPLARVGGRLSLIVPLAALAGLLATLTLILLYEYFSGTVKSGEELAELSNVAYLGAVAGRRPRGRRKDSRGLLFEARPHSREAAAYRLLAAKLESSASGVPLRSLLVLGTDDGLGSGEMAANLAAALAETGRRVTLVDADGERAEITGLLGLEQQPGIRELLAEGEPPARLSASRSSAGMDVLPRGLAPDGRPLDAARVRHLLERLLAQRDLIVVNAEPVERSSSTVAWARSAEATVLLVSRGSTRREAVGSALDSLRVVGANVIGTVLGVPTTGALDDVPSSSGRAPVSTPAR